MTLELSSYAGSFLSKSFPFLAVTCLRAERSLIVSRRVSFKPPRHFLNVFIFFPLCVYVFVAKQANK